MKTAATTAEWTGRPAAPLPHVRVEKVLVVDDEEALRSLLKRALEKPGRVVETAPDGESALARIEAGGLDVVVTDLKMPGRIGGQELFRRIKGLPRGPEVILVSGMPDLESTLEAFRYGAWDYLVKPLNIDDLRGSVERCLRHRRSVEVEDPERLRETLLAAHRKLNAINGMRGVLSRYLDKEIVDAILGSGSTETLRAEKRQVSVLFTDIRGFTGYAAGRSSDVVVAVLNSLLGRLAEIVMKNHGVIDKYTGDGMMAVFGAPRPCADHAEKAARTALQMLEAAEEWNREREKRGLERLEIGIGLNSGTAVAGSVGSAARSDYTVIGSVVNMAARLEHLAAPGKILVGPATAAEISTRFDVKSQGLVKMRGFNQPTTVFLLAGEKTEEIES